MLGYLLPGGREIQPSKSLRTAVLLGSLVSMLALSGCGSLMDPGGWWNAVTPWNEGKDSDSAIAAFQKGDYNRATQLANDARQRDANDPYALLTLGEIARLNGRTDVARQYYALLINLRPQQTLVDGSGPAAQRKSIYDIARERLALLNRPQVSNPTSVTPAQMAQQAAAAAAPVPVPPPPGLNLAGENNVIERFRTFAAGDPLLGFIDDNGFASTSIRASVDKALADLDAQIA